MDLVDLSFLLVGVGALLAGFLPRVLEGRPLSLPLMFLILGILLFGVFQDLPDPDPSAHPEIVEHLTEVAVIIALMGAGLRLDRRMGWRSWGTTWRLLAIAMPLMICAAALLGWWALGFAPATALLFGAALAPTDPVLASDVQVGEPGGEEDDEDEVRFALTSEAGLNDALAFPFVYAAIAVAAAGGFSWGLVGDWVLQDVVIKVAIGLVGGIAVGRLLGALFFRPPSEHLHLASHAEGFIALAATFLTYGAIEVLGGYGFLGVFMCARAIRTVERTHEYHQVLHNFVEQIERLLTVLLLVLIGGSVVRGLLEPITWVMLAVGLALVLVVRPATAFLSLLGANGTLSERSTIAVFGIRGIGSIYYVAYAIAHAPFEQAQELWASVALVVVISVVFHGIAATPAMKMIDARLSRDR